MRTLPTLLLLGCALAPASMLAESDKLRGTWLMTISFDGAPPPGFPPTFPVMHTFVPSGEVIETDALGGGKGPGLGEWAAVGPWQFRYTLRFFVYDQSGSGTITGYAQVRTWIQTDREYSKFQGCRFIGEIFDLSGNRLLMSSGPCTGSRIPIDLLEPAAVPASANQ